MMRPSLLAHAPARARARGAALLTAMLMVALVATLAATMVWQQWRAVQVEAAERAQSQAQWILNGALDWARLILREDARNVGPDHLGEPWAVPLAEARLSTFLAADKDHADDAPEAFLSGMVRDAQARYNLRNLVSQGKVQPAELQTLQSLCELAGVPGNVAGQIAQALQQATSALGTGSSPAGTPPATGQPAVPAPTGPAPLMPSSLRQLSWWGLDAATLAKLQPHVVLLPRATPLNLNTAGKEALAAVLGGSLANAQCLIQQRQRNPLQTPQDAAGCVSPTMLQTAQAAQPPRIAVSSNFFEVTGSLRLEALRVTQRSLVERFGRPSLEVKVLSTERLSPADKLADSPQQ